MGTRWAPHVPAGRPATFLGSPSSPFEELSHQGRPAGLMTGAQSLAGFGIEVLIEQDQVFPIGVCGELPVAAVQRALPGGASGRNRRVRRADISDATSPRVIVRPDPVGNSTRKSWE